MFNLLYVPRACRRAPIVAVCGLTIAAASSAAAQASRVANADVPITKVILFSSGVGYFEHTGVVHGNAATQLRFKTDQINDILKSIMLQDQDGGRVGAITYPSQDPVDKTLRSFQIDITQNPSLAELLNQLRGARVTIQLQAGPSIAGTVLGVETRNKAAGQSVATTVAVLNVLSGATIREVELPSIANLTLDDPELQAELTKALSALVQSRDQDKKPVTIDFTGTGDRHVRIGYVVETPIWKTSYRLLLADTGTKAALQGWAIVENQTENDWKNVSLSLVSGRPISFKMDLYQPMYATRPTVVPELYAGLHPQVYEGGTDEDAAHPTMEAPGEVPPAPAPRAVAGGRANGTCVPRTVGCGPDGRPAQFSLSAVVTTSTGAQARENDFSSVQSSASTAELGDLFQYTVANVTLARQKSAMLPIVTDSVQAERVSIYNEGVLRSNPLTGVLMKNTSGKHLLQGPVTVLEQGGYAGDARIDDVPPGQSRLLSYGIDLEMPVHVNHHLTAEVVAAKISNGVVVFSRRITEAAEYVADNKSNKSKTLVVEHPTRYGLKIASSEKPFETTPTVYRFKKSVPANKVTTFAVSDESVNDEPLTLISVDANLIQNQAAGAHLAQNVRDALDNVIRQKQAITALSRDLAAKTQQITSITADQNRIRENMKAVAQSGDYYNRLLSKLNEQETQIEQLQAEQRSMSEKLQGLQKQLADYIATLNVG
ncbi:MAG TPA: hypothetical protein VGM67_18065 [Gemmatimonadaceae bacterium]